MRKGALETPPTGKALLSSLWHPANLRLRTCTGDDGTVTGQSKRPVSARFLAAIGGLLRPSKPEIATVRRFLGRDATAVDVGAGSGLLTAVLARGSARVLAFEPHPARAARLREMRLRNCTIVEAGLSNAVGTAELRLPVDAEDESAGLGSIEADHGLGHRNAASSVVQTVETTTLDKAVETHLQPGDKVGFIRLSVEGHELAVLEGAEVLIARDRPVLMSELEFRYSIHVPETFAFLQARGYRALAIAHGDALAPIDATRLSDLQSQDLLRRKMQKPRDRGYVSSVFFLPVERVLGADQSQ